MVLDPSPLPLPEPGRVMTHVIWDMTHSYEIWLISYETWLTHVRHDSIHMTCRYGWTKISWIRQSRRLRAINASFGRYAAHEHQTWLKSHETWLNSYEMSLILWEASRDKRLVRQVCRSRTSDMTQITGDMTQFICNRTQFTWDLSEFMWDIPRFMAYFIGDIVW